MSIFARYQGRFEAAQEEEMSIQDYLDLCRKDPTAYASVAERMLRAIGEPELVDTRTDQRLSRIFANKILRRYPSFGDLYGMEEAIEHIVSYFRHAAQGLEEKKQILYLISRSLSVTGARQLPPAPNSFSGLIPFPESFTSRNMTSPWQPRHTSITQDTTRRGLRLLPISTLKFISEQEPGANPSLKGPSVLMT